jgi:Tfp pilus assembly protein PilV
MCTIKKNESDETGLSLVEAMFSIAILSIAALAIGIILSTSFQQTNTAENVLNLQTYGMSTAVSGTYSAAANIPVNVNISSTAKASNSGIPDAVIVSGPTASIMTIAVTTAPVTSGSNLPSWWLP